MALKLHFTTEKFNVWKSREWVRISEEKFLSSPRRPHFERLAKTFRTPRKFIQFCVANFAYGTSIFEMNSASASFIKWSKIKQSLSHTIENDVEFLSQEETWIFGGDVPPAIKFLNQGKINIETLVAINREAKFTQWSNWKYNFAFPGLWLKIEKLDGFVGTPSPQVISSIQELVYETV